MLGWTRAKLRGWDTDRTVVVCIQGLDWSKARQEVTRDALDVSMG